MNGVDVANTALMEVGFLPAAVRHADGEFSVPSSRNVEKKRVAYRAKVLGSIAESGPAALVRCFNCSPNGPMRGKVSCTPARDALRGVTCEARP